MQLILVSLNNFIFLKSYVRLRYIEICQSVYFIPPKQLFFSWSINKRHCLLSEIFDIVLDIEHREKCFLFLNYQILLF